MTPKTSPAAAALAAVLVTALSVPAGALDLRQFDAVWQTLCAEPEWQSRIDAGVAQMARENAETQTKIAQIRRDMHADTVRTIREVDVYRGSSGPAAELPHHDKNHWKLNDGSYVLTDHHGFDPGRDLGVQRERLQLAR